MITRLLTALLLAAIVPLAAQERSAQVMSWKIDGTTRQAIVYAHLAPANREKLPLVFSFHGRGDDAENFQNTEMHSEWPEAIVVYFQGLPSPGSGLFGWQLEKGQDEDRDLKLVDAALASLRQAFSIDEARIFATGFSNGAGFTYLLWAERSQVFAAYAPVAGRLRPSVHPNQPRPVFHIAGKLDRQIPFTDQTEAIEMARRLNSVTGGGEPCGNGCTIYGSSTKAPVMTWIHEGGHVYPQSTSRRIAGFFRDHPRATASR